MLLFLQMTFLCGVHNVWGLIWEVMTHEVPGSNPVSPTMQIFVQCCYILGSWERPPPGHNKIYFLVISSLFKSCLWTPVLHSVLLVIITWKLTCFFPYVNKLYFSYHIMTRAITKKLSSHHVLAAVLQYEYITYNIQYCKESSFKQLSI